MSIRFQGKEPRNRTGSEPLFIDDPVRIRESYSRYLFDESRFQEGCSNGIWFPRCERQVRDILVEASRKRTPLTPSAARTGIVGGAVPCGGHILSIDQMHHILSAETDDTGTWHLTLEPGVSLDRLSRFLDSNGTDVNEDFTDDSGFLSVSHNWFYPPDPTEKSAHLGGTVATDASGSRSLFYGPTRNHVHGLRVVLINGTVLDLKRGMFVRAGERIEFPGPGGSLYLTIPLFHRKPIKNTAAYHLDDPLDLMDLFIGSEGTLGVITEITVILSRKPVSLLGIVCFYEQENQAIRFAKRIRQENRNRNSTINACALEFFDQRSLFLLREKSPHTSYIRDKALAAIYIEQDISNVPLEEILTAYDRLLQENGSSLETAWVAWDARSLRTMMDFRHDVPEIINGIIEEYRVRCPSIHKIGTDYVVPEHRFEEMMSIYRKEVEHADLEYVIFGHIGENHVHVNLMPSNDFELERAKAVSTVLAKQAVQFGGSVCGEHGIGKIKKGLLEIMFTDEEIKKFRSVKNDLDPHGLLSPGTLF